MSKPKTIVPASFLKKLSGQIVNIIEQNRHNALLAVNTHLTAMYWQTGKALNDAIISSRAAYGEQILATLSQELTERYGKGYTMSALSRMQKFQRLFPDQEILATLSQELSWSHFIELINLKDELQRDFYLRLTLHERWSVRRMRERINSMLFERTAISKKPGNLIKSELKQWKEKGELTNDLVFRNDYLFDFLGLKNVYTENELETAILIELQNFIVELGTDFAFLARQKRIIVGGEDYRIDLLFYHRSLKRLVAIDLKLGKFKPDFKSQMELYLRWLEKYEMKDGEELPIGLILCTDAEQELIELLMLNDTSIKVARYLTQLPSKKLLQEKLHTAIEIAKKRLDLND
jgi:predicted nuclease of restriction endonuclease-like (RecB) superfamily